MTGQVVQKITNGRWRQNCYVVRGASGNALIIDPGGDSERIIEYIEDNALKPRAILNTHAHYDHIGAVAAVKSEFSVPFYLHSGEMANLKHANLYRKLFDDDVPITVPEVDCYLDQVETLESIEGLPIRVLFTPGHTRGGVSFQIEDCLFTGDTLFKGSIGRTDLPGGNSVFLSESLRELGLIPPGTVIYPGHGTATTMADELQNNSELRKAIDANQD